MHLALFWQLHPHFGYGQLYDAVALAITLGSTSCAANASCIVLAG